MASEQLSEGQTGEGTWYWAGATNRICAKQTSREASCCGLGNLRKPEATGSCLGRAIETGEGGRFLPAPPPNMRLKCGAGPTAALTVVVGSSHSSVRLDLLAVIKVGLACLHIGYSPP